MSAGEVFHIDLERGSHRRSVAGSELSSGSDEMSCYSQFYSTTGGSYDDYSFGCGSDAEISGSRRTSSVWGCSEEVEMREIVVHLAKEERDCRICHLALESDSNECGVPIELGCSCKDDLAAAHKQCAETWFKIKGNKVCEICHSIARNVSGPSEIEAAEHSSDDTNASDAAANSAPDSPSETRSFWQRHRFLNFLLACIVFAFVISWLFHFDMRS